MGERFNDREKNGESFSSPNVEEIVDKQEQEVTPETTETSPEDEVEKARKEVEKINTYENTSDDQEENSLETSHEKTGGVLTTKDKTKIYKDTLAKTQSELKGTSRTFSKIIHNRVVESSSELLSKTVARPTSILYGSILAFAVMLVVYLFAKKNGFELSGSELILLFAAGWILGIIADLLKKMISQKN